MTYNLFLCMTNADGPQFMKAQFKIFLFYNEAKAICIQEKPHFEF